MHHNLFWHNYLHKCFDKHAKLIGPCISNWQISFFYVFQQKYIYVIFLRRRNSGNRYHVLIFSTSIVSEYSNFDLVVNFCCNFFLPTPDNFFDYALHTVYHTNFSFINEYIKIGTSKWTNCYGELPFCRVQRIQVHALPINSDVDSISHVVFDCYYLGGTG